MTDSGFSDLVLSQVEPDQKLDLPQVVYDKDGDCIEFITVDEDFKACRLNSMLTVYIGRESGDIVGSLIRGVHSICSCRS